MSMQALLGLLYLVISAKIKFHDSPVEHLNKVKKDLKNPIKLAFSPRPSPLGLTYENKFMPSTLYKNKTKNNRPPIFANAGTVIIKVVNIILKLLALLTSLKTLAILNVLMMDVVDPMFSTTLRLSNIIPIRVKTTTAKSKLFQES